MHKITLPSGNVADGNGDFSGVIEIVYKEDQWFGVKSTKIPMNDLIAIVAEYVRRGKIGRLENVSDSEILGLK